MNAGRRFPTPNLPPPLSFLSSPFHTHPELLRHVEGVNRFDQATRDGANVFKEVEDGQLMTLGFRRIQPAAVDLDNLGVLPSARHQGHDALCVGRRGIGQGVFSFGDQVQVEPAGGNLDELLAADGAFVRRTVDGKTGSNEGDTGT